MIVLAAVKPSEQEMLSYTSPAMQKMIEKDAESSRKRVTVTYSKPVGDISDHNRHILICI